jgi:hypothetical protein
VKLHIMFTEDDDWMIPRRLHEQSGAPEVVHDPGIPSISVDPGFIERRKERRGHVPQQPSSDSEASWDHIDRRMGEAFPTFE